MVGLMRGLVVLPLLSTVAAMRSDFEDGSLAADQDAISSAAILNASSASRAPRWLMTGTIGCPSTVGWNLEDRLLAFEQMANPEVYFIDVQSWPHSCTLGMKVITERDRGGKYSWTRAWGSSGVTFRFTGALGGGLSQDQGSPNIELQSDVARHGFRLMINQKEKTWSIISFQDVGAVSVDDFPKPYAVIFPNAPELFRWHQNPLVEPSHRCYSHSTGGTVAVKAAKGPFAAWPMAVLRLEPSEGWLDLERLKGQSAPAKFSASVQYEAMIQNVLTRWNFEGVQVSVVAATGSAGKAKKSLKLAFQAAGGYEITGPSGLEQNYFLGTKVVSLRANANDCTLVRELLVTDLYYAMCVPSYRQIPVKVFIGDNYYSTFLMTEWFDEGFVERAFSRRAGSGDVLADMGYGETFTQLPNSQLYGQGYHLKPQGGCPQGSQDLGSLCKVEYEKATFIDVTGAGAWPETEREYLGQLISGINAVTVHDASPMTSVLNADEVLRAMAVDLAVGQWDDFYRNYNNFFLFRELIHGSPFYHVIPFDCDWAFHRKAHFDSGDRVGYNADWDHFCCLSNAFQGEKSRLIDALLKNTELRNQFLGHLQSVLTEYFLPQHNYKSKVRSRLDYVWGTIGREIRGDEFWGKCQRDMQTANDFGDLEVHVNEHACWLLNQMANKHVGNGVQCS